MGRSHMGLTILESADMHIRRSLSIREGSKMKEHHFRAAGSRRLLRLAFIAAAIVAPILAVGAPVQASTAAAAHSAKTSSGVALAKELAPAVLQTSCGYGSSSGNVYTCAVVNRTGGLLVSLKASAKVINAARTIQVCTHDPRGPVACTAFYTVYPGA